ncbi:PAS domain S-box protein [Telluribacter sp.]|jgi:PAS domain S-box-containing protein|uniref:PAS domain-containing sensor histidine kinase n=1 Tax=Telluribacter sp. TaxID=1978767 RepID=UPI002E0FFB9C|nr:PAS domain S-box protein [Telluribacter sp.]
MTNRDYSFEGPAAKAQTTASTGAPREAFWDWDVASDRIWWNEGFTTLFGYNAKELKPGAETWNNCVHPEDRERVLISINKVIEKGGTEWSEEYRFRRADGSYAYVFDRGYTIQIDQKPVRMVGSISDISERIELRKAQQQSEDWMRFALEAAELGTWTYNPATGAEVWDDRCREIFGVPKGSGPAQNGYTMQQVHPDDADRLWKTVQAAMDPVTGGSYHSDHRIIDATTGKVKWVRSRGKAFFTSEGVPYSFAGTIMDITEEKRKEAALANVEKRFQAGFDNASLGIVIADLSGKLILVNKAFNRMIGYAQEELYQGWFTEITHPDDLDKSKEQVQRLMTGEADSFFLEKRYLHKEGRVIWATIHTTLLFDEQGNRDCFFSIIQDITAEVALREEQRKLLALVENSVELMSILELDGRNSYINKAGMDMLGFENEQEVLETSISALHAPEHFELVEKEVLPSLMEKGRWSGSMLVRHLKTGEIFPVYNNTIRIDDPLTGQPLAVGAVMRDMRPELAAQEALITSEERFRNIIAQAPVAIGVFRGLDMVIESANEPILELWGKGPEIIGKPLLQALPEIKGQGFMELLEGVYTTGKPFFGYEILARLNRRNQLEDCYFNFVYAPLREAGNTITGVTVIGSEVTQQVVTKRELEVSEKRFRNLIIDAPMATAVYAGQDMVIQLANEAMLKLWGKDESVIGKKIAEAIPELEGQPFLGKLAQVYRSGQEYHGKEDKADLVVDGKLQSFYFNYTYKPLHDADGKVYAILNMAVDITYQVEARKQLMEVEESLREAIDLAELGTWSIYPLTGKIEYSERVKEWIGVIDREVTLEDIAMSTHEKDRARTSEISQRELAPEGSGKLDMEYTIVNRQTGQERILHTQARALFNEEGQVYLMRGTSQDITAQRLTQQELERQVELRTEQLQKSNNYLLQSNQELEQYAYVASHDLQEPLRKIRIFSDMLGNMKGLSEEAKDTLSKVISSSERMSLLIKDLLEYSRLLKSEIKILATPLTEVLEKVVDDFELTIEEKQARIELGELPTIEAVPLQMNQLFYNLLNNALKFTRESVPPVISIQCRRLSEQEVQHHQLPPVQCPYYDITFTDNGIGFSPEYAERIFEVFKRLHTRAVYPGSGIGLALCRRIVQNHQGYLYAESEEDKGSVFHVILPQKQIEE